MSGNKPQSNFPSDCGWVSLSYAAEFRTFLINSMICEASTRDVFARFLLSLLQKEDDLSKYFKKQQKLHEFLNANQY